MRIRWKRNAAEKIEVIFPNTDLRQRALCPLVVHLPRRLSIDLDHGASVFRYFSYVTLALSLIETRGYGGGHFARAPCNDDDNTSLTGGRSLHAKARGALFRELPPLSLYENSARVEFCGPACC